MFCLPFVICTYFLLPYCIKKIMTGIQMIGTIYQGVIVRFSKIGFPKSLKCLSTGEVTHSLYLDPKFPT